MDDNRYCGQEFKKKSNLSAENKGDSEHEDLLLNFYSEKIRNLNTLSLSASPLLKRERKSEHPEFSDSQCCH